MSFKFNPFTGNLDYYEASSGSSGISFADLATPPAATALGSASLPFDTLFAPSIKSAQDGLAFYSQIPDSWADGAALTPVLAGAGAGNLSNGVYSYKFTMIRYLGSGVYGGETAAGSATPTVTVVNAAANGKITVQLPYTCDQASSEQVVIYRTAANGSVYKRVAQYFACGLTYTDNVADASLGATAPTTNTTLGTTFSFVNGSLVAIEGDGFGDSVFNLGKPTDTQFEIVGTQPIVTGQNSAHLRIAAAGNTGSGNPGSLILDSGYKWIGAVFGASLTLEGGGDGRFRAKGTTFSWQTNKFTVDANGAGVFASSVTATDFAGGTWQGKTLTLANSFITSGNFSLTLTQTGATNVTLPTSGTLLVAAPLLSANATDVTAGSVARGDLITGQGATPKWVRLAKGTANQVLTMDGTATDIAWATPASGGVTSIATTSPISGGTITSTGTISLLVNVDFAWTVPQSITNAGIAATSTDGLTLLNTTAATSGVAVQQSPRLRFRSQVWNTTSVAATNTNDFFLESVPVSGTTPSGLLKFGSSLNGATATYPLTVDSAGHVQSGTDGALTAPSYSRIGQTNTGMYFPGGNQVGFSANGVSALTLSSSEVVPGATFSIAWNGDTYIRRGGAASTIQLGLDLNGAAIAQTIQAANGITGTDKAGANFDIGSGKGTGAATESAVTVSTPTAVASGTTAQTRTTRLTINSSGIKATGYLSSDGTAGVTAGPFTTITSITVKNGLVTALTGA